MSFEDSCDLPWIEFVRRFVAILMTGIGVAGCAVNEIEPRVAREMSCPAKDGRTEGEWYSGPSTFEHADSSRTHLFKAIREPDARRLSEGAAVEVETFPGYPGVYNFAVRSPGEVYLLGGVTSGRSNSAPPYVARVEMPSGREIWRTALRMTESKTDAVAWTYPGVIGIPANGDIYVVQDNRLTRIDPTDGSLVGRTELPTRGAAADSAYNGFSALPNGYLVLKSHHRPAGCAVDGFRAFLVCGTEGASASVLAVVDPETMDVIGEADAPELIGGRITVANFGQRTFVYAPGVDYLHRFEWRNRRLEYDDSWGPVRYRQGRETPATAAAVLGEFVIVQSNALPTDAPSRLTAVSQLDPSRRFEIQPFADKSQSMIPSMPSVDPEMGLIFVTDGLAPGLAAIRLDPQNGLETVWRKDQGSLSFSALVGPRAGRVLISSDIADGYRIDYKRESVVWRDAATGTLLGRSSDFPRMGGTVLAPDCGGVVYVASSRMPQIHRLEISAVP